MLSTVNGAPTTCCGSPGARLTSDGARSVGESVGDDEADTVEGSGVAGVAALSGRARPIPKSAAIIVALLIEAASEVNMAAG
jgi:hypothetical protein